MLIKFHRESKKKKKKLQCSTVPLSLLIGQCQFDAHVKNQHPKTANSHRRGFPFSKQISLQPLNLSLEMHMLEKDGKSRYSSL